MLLKIVFGQCHSNLGKPGILSPRKPFQPNLTCYSNANCISLSQQSTYIIGILAERYISLKKSLKRPTIWLSTIYNWRRRKKVL